MLRHVLFLTSLLAHCVWAGIYGTWPVADTVLSAGRVTTIEWINDHRKPSIDAMGPIKIVLYVGENAVATLADHVDPASLAANVWISPALGHNGSDYHIRFICQDPPVAVYTADFTIIDMASISPMDGLTTDAHNESAPTVTYITPQLTLVLPDATVVSTLKPTPITMRPTATAPPLSFEKDGWHPELPIGAAMSMLGKRSTFDAERFKFQLVFVFWPALVGVTMAL
ncbi:hypothetical protein C2E23DRAFT_853037 [Lenzites betulinus]|nr:hypothetical protein C2E23DRAFT_853037 [Lenzites betulinus]